MNNCLVEAVMTGVVMQLAENLADCDFRVSISRYISGGGGKWIITVGEQGWRQHLVVESIAPDGRDAAVSLLSPEQSGKSGYDIDVADVQATSTVNQLVRGGYTQIKTIFSHYSRGATA